MHPHQFSFKHQSIRIVKQWSEQSIPLSNRLVVAKHHASSWQPSLPVSRHRAPEESYSRVQVSFIAGTIKLPIQQVEKKLSQMILDKKFSGILDQGDGVLIVFEETPVDKTYDTALETISHMSKVVDTLYQKAKKLS